MNMFEKRVDAAYQAWVNFPRVRDVNSDVVAIRAALEAADAVVTEEMIAETILKALVFTNENSEAWADGLARDIAVLFRGGVK